MMCCQLLIFVFKQKTAYDMRISDWSAVVCSADLSSGADAGRVHRERDGAERTRHGSEFGRPDIGAAAGNLHIAREALPKPRVDPRSEEHTSEIQSLMRITYAVFCLK